LLRRRGSALQFRAEAKRSGDFSHQYILRRPPRHCQSNLSQCVPFASEVRKEASRKFAKVIYSAAGGELLKGCRLLPRENYTSDCQNCTQFCDALLPELRAQAAAAKPIWHLASRSDTHVDVGWRTPAIMTNCRTSQCRISHHFAQGASVRTRCAGYYGKNLTKF
jgi:hypothetical protein